MESRETSKKYYISYSDLPSFCFTLSVAGEICLANSFAVHQLGYELEDFIQRPISRFVHPEDRELFQTEWVKLQQWQQPSEPILEKQLNVFSDKQEFRLVAKNDRVIWVQVRAVLPNQATVANAAFAILLVCENITELKQTRANLERIERQLTAQQVAT